MRPPNHMPCSPDEATVAVLGEATFERKKKAISPWLDPTMDEWFTTDQLTRYGATFYKPAVPEPGYRLVTDEEKLGPMPEKFKYMESDGVWRWGIGRADNWAESCTYAVPIEKKVVAVACGVDYNSEWHMAKFQTPELRDRAVREANGRTKEDN